MKRAALVALALAAFPASAAAGGGPPLRQCPHEVVHDYLAPISGLKQLNGPKFGELPKRFGPDGLEHPRAGTTGELRRAPRLHGDVRAKRRDRTHRLEPDHDPDPDQQPGPGARQARRQADPADQGLRLPRPRSGDPGLEPTGLLSPRAENPRCLQGPIPRQLWQSTSASCAGRATPACCSGRRRCGPGETASIGIAEFGTGFLVFEPDYSVEAFDGVNWVPTAIQASTPPNFFSLVADSGLVVNCSKLPIPPGTAPGLYRLSEPVIHRWGVPRNHTDRPVLSTEFTVTP